MVIEILIFYVNDVSDELQNLEKYKKSLLVIFCDEHLLINYMTLQ